MGTSLLVQFIQLAHTVDVMAITRVLEPVLPLVKALNDNL